MPPLMEVTVQSERELWEFPHDRFVSYEETDKRWAEPLGFGRLAKHVVSLSGHARPRAMRQVIGDTGEEVMEMDFELVCVECDHGSTIQV